MNDSRAAIDQRAVSRGVHVPESAGRSADRKDARSELAMMHCPNCSNGLQSRHCKLFCDRCGYFMDCSDYY